MTKNYFGLFFLSRSILESITWVWHIFLDGKHFRVTTLDLVFTNFLCYCAIKVDLTKSVGQ